MRRRVVISPAADGDTDRIWRVIRGDNAAAADRFFVALDRTAERIAAFPASGAALRARLAALRGLRWVPVSGFPKYLVFYRETADAVVLLRVLHGARDWRRELRRGGD
ncbi:MAG: type II toxin-antitoxin system RelE/ParE family toxin [Phycisphaerales bacterium]|nr:type II toxin-antitoxin system RelE/ParE family toxin [Phycisphaerales bacterium]